MKYRIKITCFADKLYKRGTIINEVECKKITPEYYEPIIEKAVASKETAKKRTARK